ncbi:triacylglycerol lipase 1 [Ricinus communis]|uniref:Lipase n=1 Tax=Ricinus communis TaxID=3988 RepID=B9RY83_RICCO|nr:triacylglycerol lipase 1 [Ricinus communis]EEF43592.1 Triacylglycerol lipase 1 precursor, putative [Ricinus communis]|eukprot:XP_002518667.1 triacylglycerol lipase 1 [Ricinus communis]
METKLLLTLATIISLFISTISGQSPAGNAYLRLRTPGESLCSQLIEPAGYPCTEYTIQTQDGYLLALQRVSSRNGELKLTRGPPVLLQHGLFMAGDAWFLNSPDQSLGFILADQGFDVWVGNVRGTFWSYGHVYLSKKDKEFWDWSWQELALYDLAAMIHHVYSTTNSKIFIVGHSQGTIMSLAALIKPNIVEMVEAAALLCPISYLNHISAPLVLRMVRLHLDQMVVAMGIHELNFRSEVLINLLDSICDNRLECNDLLTSLTGSNCCLNTSRMDLFFEYEPHPSSTKNLRHLFQMIRQGTFSHYDYGIFKNLKLYGQVEPPAFDLSLIPKSLPLWMGYGGYDGLADVKDVEHTLEDLQSKPQLLYLENYGHIDFLLSERAKEDVFNHMIGFFRSLGNS